MGHMGISTNYRGITFGLIVLFSTCYGIIVYDCNDPKADILTISIRDVANCPDPESDYASVESKVKIIQRNEVHMIQVQTCLIEITRLITHCGMHSHSSVVAGGLSNFVHRIGADECSSVHRYKSIKLYHQNIGGIVMNGTTTASLTLAGTVNARGECKGTTYHEEGHTWEDVVITASIRIQTSDYLARVKMEEDQIHLTGGVTCPYLAGYCFDTTLGESAWKSTMQTPCEDKLSLLYQGKAEIVTNAINRERYLIVENGEKIFALTLLKRGFMCHTKIWQTEHPRIMVWMDDAENPIDPHMEILPYNTDLMSYVNSKFLYVEQAYKRNLEKLYMDTIHRRCLTHREVLRNRLLMAPLLPTMISQLVQEEGGHIGRVLGEVLYIMRCLPKLATIRRTDKCYHELPIEVNNETKFMAPVTHIIQEHAEEVDCNGVTPPFYYIEGEWIGLAPYPTVKKAPKRLKVEVAAKLNFTPILPLGTAGLYTQEEVQKAQKVLTFGSERRAVESIMARRVAGLETDGQGYSTLNIFNPTEMKELAHSTMKQVWGWFTDIGMFISGLIGFYAIFRMIKYVIGVILNGLHLYKTLGCGFALLASLWNTLTMWIVYRQRETEQNGENRGALSEVATNNEPSETTVPRAELYPGLSKGHWTEKIKARSDLEH